MSRKMRAGKSNKHKLVFPRRDILFALPGLLGFLAFFVLPFFGSIYYSLIQSNFDHTYAGFSHYAATVSNSYYQLALKNTFTFCLIFVPLGLFLALVFSLILRHIKILSSLQVVFLIPVFLPSASIIATWKLLFLSDNSYLNIFLSLINTRELLNELLLMTIMLWKSIGVLMMIIISALFNMDKEIEYAADIDGANTLQKVRYIILPYLRPILGSAAIYQLMLGLRVFKEAFLLFGAYPHDSLYQIQHYMNNHFAKLNYQNLSAGAVIFFGFTLIMLIPLLYVAAKEDK